MTIRTVILSLSILSSWRRFIAAQRNVVAGTTGLSLVELMVAVVVVAILSGLAWPAYQKSLKKAKMAEAELAVTEIANLEGKHFSDTASYSADLTDLGYKPTPPLRYYTVQVLPVEDTSSEVVYRVAASGISSDLDSVVLSVHADGTAEQWHGSPEAAVALGLVPGLTVAGGGSTPSATPVSEGSGSDSAGPVSAAPTSSSEAPSSASAAPGVGGSASAPSGGSGAGGSGGAAGGSGGSGSSSIPSASSEPPAAGPATSAAAPAPAPAAALASDSDSKDKKQKDKKEKKEKLKDLINWVKNWKK